MMANSPDFAAWAPRLFSNSTPGGNQSNGASRSRPAFVRKISFRWGAGQGNSALMTLASVTRCLGVPHRRDKIGRGYADADHVPGADIGGPRRGGLPHCPRKIEQRIVIWVLQMDTHGREPAIAANRWRCCFSGSAGASEMVSPTSSFCGRMQRRMDHFQPNSRRLKMVQTVLLSDRAVQSLGEEPVIATGAPGVDDIQHLRRRAAERERVHVGWRYVGHTIHDNALVVIRTG